jgi:hypothetical protein
VKRTLLIVLVIGVGAAAATGCSSAGGQEPAQPEAPAGEPVTNTLKWTTASEVDNFGFDIYRSLSEDGPFERITSEPLAGAGTTDEPQNYVYVDQNINPTKDYYYYIESISLGGVREIFSPIIRAPAKQPAGGGS